MKYYIETEESLKDFQFWGNALTTIEKVILYDEEYGTSFWSWLCEKADELFTGQQFCTENDINNWMSDIVPDYEELAEIF